MRSVIFLLLLMISSPSFSQIIFEPELTWEQAAKKAKAENKLVFIHLEDDNCQQCNEVASKGFGTSILKEKYEKNFVSIRANVKTERGKKLAEKFEIKGALVSLYVDAEGNILNRFNGSTSAGFIYAEQADIALGRKGDKQLGQFAAEYKAGERSGKFLKEYITKRKGLSLPVDDLLEQYVGQLLIDSLKNYNVVKFIYANGPSLDSRAYNIVQSGAPERLIDSVYKKIPREEAIAMNNAIISNTFRIAVERKDLNLAQKLSSFTHNTYNKEFQKGYLASRRGMLRFYYAIKDTTHYRREVKDFLDYTHMRITADSLKKIDDVAMKNQPVIPPAPWAKESVRMVRFSPPSQFYHMELNEHAWHFFEMFDNANDLETALKWSHQSMEFFNGVYKERPGVTKLGNPAYMDTYAQILYKLGRKPEAIEWQTKAVETQKATGNPSGSFEATLAKMKEGKL